MADEVKAALQRLYEGARNEANYWLDDEMLSEAAKAHETLKKALGIKEDGKCPECNGTGVDPNMLLLSNPPQPAPCRKCGGTGNG